MRTTSFCLFAIVLTATALSAGDVSNRWSSMSATAFTRCAAENDCLGEAPCDEESLELGGDCFVECVNFNNPPGIPFPCFSLAESQLGWQTVTGTAGHFPCPGDVLVGTEGFAQGARLSESEFEINANVNQTGSTEKTVEISLFRFAGDPAQFNGLDLNRVSDLVDLGLIAAGDVLFVTEIQGFGVIQQTVDVSGIPDAELVLFAAGDGPFPSDTGCETPDVPALGAAGSAALIGVLVLLTALILRLRRVD